MKTCLDCIPCFFRQALRAGRIAQADDQILKQLLDEFGVMLGDLSLSCTPPEIAMHLYGRVRHLTGKDDPFHEIKRESTERALARYDSLKQLIVQADDRLLTAIRIAIAGNIIDFGVSSVFDVEATIDQALHLECAIDDVDQFRQRLAACESVLYIGDNAGETVFDRLLIEQLDRPVTFAVRGEPVINDATCEDAIAAGIDDVATVVSSGTPAPGAIVSTCSPEFVQMLEQSTFTIAKGQGNYEALSQEPYPIVFLLKAKCPVIATDLGVQVGDLICRATKPARAGS